MSCSRPSLRLYTNASRHSSSQFSSKHPVQFSCRSFASPASPVIERYAAKLSQRAKETGYTDVEALKSAHIINTPSQHNKAPVPPSNGGRPAQKPSSAPVKQLSAYLDIEKAAVLPAKEIEMLWRLRHANDPCSLSAVIPASTYTKLSSNAREYPCFILPLPRPSTPDADQNVDKPAVEVHFLQHALMADTTSTTLFTPLAEFKLRGEYASPHTTVMYHSDFAKSHGIVLMNGSITEGRGVTIEQAQFLLVSLQKFYAGMGDEASTNRRQGLLEQFTRGDEKFKVEDVIEETERIV
ncbi:MAG: hypothetical protein M1814_003950 [Vezdaea aestivalis]|nr:MAG: hypothetical protein M1814_003950 [Vezdaea aestivalis]